MVYAISQQRDQCVNVCRAIRAPIVKHRAAAVVKLELVRITHARMEELVQTSERRVTVVSAFQASPERIVKQVINNITPNSSILIILYYLIYIFFL